MIFVFGSNEGGHHGLGAAKTAREKYGAIMGQGYGLMGQSFGIPTKDKTIRHTLPRYKINEYVTRFLLYAGEHPEMEFGVTRIGCGLAGLRDSDVAPMFRVHPANCLFDTKWIAWLPAHTQFWGTY